MQGLAKRVTKIMLKMSKLLVVLKYCNACFPCRNFATKNYSQSEGFLSQLIRPLQYLNHSLAFLFADWTAVINTQQPDTNNYVDYDVKCEPGQRLSYIGTSYTSDVKRYFELL